MPLEDGSFSWRPLWMSTVNSKYHNFQRGSKSDARADAAAAADTYSILAYEWFEYKARAMWLITGATIYDLPVITVCNELLLLLADVK